MPEACQKAGEMAWYVAIVNNRAERKYAQLLSEKGYETYVPVWKDPARGRSTRKGVVERVLIATIVFVRCAERERILLLKLPYVKHFMVDRTKKDRYGRHPVATIPHRQIEAFRMCVERMEEPAEVAPVPYRLGDRVRVVDGKFAGLEGHVVQHAEGESHLVVCLGTLGCLKLNISLNLVTRI